jgi:colanic acid biosynthesis glycosyl transferase WcaI
LRILLLTTYFQPDVAANGVIMSALTDEFVANGHEVTVLTTVPHYNINRVWPEYSGKLIFSERRGPLQIHRLYTYVAKDKANIAKRILAYGTFHLLSTIKASTVPKHDVVLVPSPPLSNGIVADLVNRVRGIPFVYNVQDIWPDVAVRAGLVKNEATVRRLRRVEDYVYRRAAGITVLSEGFRRNLLAKGVPDEKIQVIPNFVDTRLLTPQPKENSFSKKHGLENHFVVLFAGNMGFSQGLETVVDAARILKDITNIKFLMIGNGAGRASAELHMRDLGLQNMNFMPYQPSEELPSIYGTADICLIPLRRGFATESVPSKLNSIMAAGKPAIASIDRDSETWELLDRSKSGICIEPENAKLLANAILQYYGDLNARISAGRNGRNWAETEFCPTTIARKYLNSMQLAVERNERIRR